MQMASLQVSLFCTQIRSYETVSHMRARQGKFYIIISKYHLYLLTQKQKWSTWLQDYLIGFTKC